MLIPFELTDGTIYVEASQIVSVEPGPGYGRRGKGITEEQIRPSLVRLASGETLHVLEPADEVAARINRACAAHPDPLLDARPTVHDEKLPEGFAADKATLEAVDNAIAARMDRLARVARAAQGVVKYWPDQPAPDWSLRTRLLQEAIDDLKPHDLGGPGRDEINEAEKLASP